MVVVSGAAKPYVEFDVELVVVERAFAERYVVSIWTVVCHAVVEEYGTFAKPKLH